MILLVRISTQNIYDIKRLFISEIVEIKKKKEIIIFTTFFNFYKMFFFYCYFSCFLWLFDIRCQWTRDMHSRMNTFNPVSLAKRLQFKNTVIIASNDFYFICIRVNAGTLYGKQIHLQL